MTKLQTYVSRDLNQLAADFIRARAPRTQFNLQTCASLVVASGEDIIAAVIYDNWHKNHSYIEASIAANGKLWCNRRTLRDMFSYPFEYLGVHKLITFSPAGDEHLTKFNEQLGFTHEGIFRLKPEFGNNLDAWGMFREECKWLGDYGKEIRRRHNHINEHSITPALAG